MENKKSRNKKITRAKPVLLALEHSFHSQPEASEDVDRLYLDFCCFLSLSLFAKMTEDMDKKEKADTVKSIVAAWRKNAIKKHNASLNGMNSMIMEVMGVTGAKPSDVPFDIDEMKNNFKKLASDFSNVVENQLFGINED